jgi:hypothetical protein
MDILIVQCRAAFFQITVLTYLDLQPVISVKEGVLQGSLKVVWNEVQRISKKDKRVLEKEQHQFFQEAL